MQQADGWREPEDAFFGADLAAGAGMDWLEWQHGFGKEAAVQLPWRAESGLWHTSSNRATAQSRSLQESLPSLLHDTRNMVAAMELYCDLLEEPGVLAAPFRHYAGELRLVANASRRLLEKLAPLDRPDGSCEREWMREAESLPDADCLLESDSFAQLSPCVSEIPVVLQGSNLASMRPRALPVSRPVSSLAEELLANRNLLAALAGPAVTVGLSVSGADRPIAMTGDDLTRILVNLTRNAVDVMPEGGHIQIALEERPDRLILSFTDNGPGIPNSALKAIFSPGYSTHINLTEDSETGRDFHLGSGAAAHRGLGLTIVRSLVSSAGGSVRAENRAKPECALEEENRGASFLLEFPLEPSLTP